MIGSELEVSTFEQEILDRTYDCLKPLHGLTFEIQGEVIVTKVDNQISLCISPLEVIRLMYLRESLWKVEFVVNDADGRNENWEHTGFYGHVVHSFRGYIVRKVAEIANTEQLLAVARMR